MTFKRTQYAAWILTIGAIGCAAMTFPAIGNSSSAHLEKLSASSPEALNHTPSTSALQMVDLSAAQPIEAQRDAAYIDDLLQYNQKDRTTLKNTLSERTCLAEAVYYEARSETHSGQKAVAEVVTNRVKSKHFPNTICGVVYQGAERKTGCQFSFTCDGSMDAEPEGKAWQRAQDVAALVMSGGVDPMTNKATHYHTMAVKPKWSGTMRMTRRVGSHVFYRFAPRNYKPSEPITLAPPPS